MSDYKVRHMNNMNNTQHAKHQNELGSEIRGILYSRQYIRGLQALSSTDMIVESEAHTLWSILSVAHSLSLGAGKVSAHSRLRRDGLLWLVVRSPAFLCSVTVTADTGAVFTLLTKRFRHNLGKRRYIIIYGLKQMPSDS